jgi:hypothetical protein
LILNKYRKNKNRSKRRLFSFRFILFSKQQTDTQIPQILEFLFGNDFANSPHFSLHIQALKNTFLSVLIFHNIPFAD